MKTSAKRTATTRTPPATPAPAEAPVWIATTSFVCTVEGRRYNVTAGTTRVASGHPVLQGRQHLFRRADDNLTFSVEQATDTPGERRGA